MSIIVDANIYKLQDRLNISSERFADYGLKTIDEIIEAEAAQGNMAAVQYAKELFTDPKDLAEILVLADPENKFRIMYDMNEEQLKKLLPFLEPEEMIIGLGFFTKEKILELMEKIPKEELLSSVFEAFSQDDVMKLMPQEYMDKFFASTELNKTVLFSHMKDLEPVVLAQMIESVTGEPVQNMNNTAMITQIQQMSEGNYLNAMKAMDPNVQRELVLNMGKDNSDIFMIFDTKAYTGMLNYLQKPDLLKSMDKMQPESLLFMLDKLPQNLMSVVTTQVDSEVFAEYLIKECPEILEEIVAFNLS